MTELEIADRLRSTLVAFLIDERRKSEAGEARSPTITYGELARRSGLGIIARNLGRYLAIVGKRGANRGEPMLDSLVVTARTRRPGAGYQGGAFNEEAWQRAVEACHQFQDY